MKRGMRHMILSSVACLGLQYFSTLPHKRHDFRKKKSYWTQKYVLILSTPFVWNITHSNKWARYEQKRLVGFVSSTHYLGPILKNLEFSKQFSKNTQKSKFPENPSSRSRVVPCVQTDRQKLTATFRSFENTPNTDSHEKLQNFLFLQNTK
jgi:hypothetical protein